MALLCPVPMGVVVGPFRATLAWAGACLVGVEIGMLSIAATNVILRGGSWLSVESFVMASTLFYAGAVAFVAPLSVLIVFLVRTARIRRPWADAVGGAAAAITGALAEHTVLDLNFIGHVTSDPVLVPFALVSGLIAGPVYWWLAGKPRPPYLHTEAPGR